MLLSMEEVSQHLPKPLCCALSPLVWVDRASWADAVVGLREIVLKNPQLLKNTDQADVRNLGGSMSVALDYAWIYMTDTNQHASLQTCTWSLCSWLLVCLIRGAKFPTYSRRTPTSVIVSEAHILHRQSYIHQKPLLVADLLAGICSCHFSEQEINSSMVTDGSSSGGTVLGPWRRTLSLPFRAL